MATEKIELTKLRLDNLLPAAVGHRYEIADTHVSGLRVRVGDQGISAGRYRGKASQISFVLLARFPRSPHPTRRQLGSYAREYPELTLQQARQKALFWKALVSRGIDPADEVEREKSQAEEARREASRNRQVLRDVLNRYAGEKLVQLRGGKAVRRSLEGEKGLLRDFLDLPIVALTREALLSALRLRAATSPISANRQLAYANAFFNWCVEEGVLSASPSARIRKPSKEFQRDRYHQLSELAEIWAAAPTLGYPFAHLYQLLITLPMRREELAGLPLEELSLEQNDADGGPVWTLPAHRTKRANALRIPLPSLASSIIREAIDDPARPKDSPFVFSTTGGSPVSGFSKAKRRLDAAILRFREEAAAGTGTQTQAMPHWTVHDLRTTFNTHACERLGVSAAVADRILNHVATATTSKIMRIYNKSEMFEARRHALRAWESLLRQEVIGR